MKGKRLASILHFYINCVNVKYANTPFYDQTLPKVEQHDIYHMLTGYGTKVEDEIALQYLCLGNGKRSLYLIGAITLGTILLPEYANYYYQSYKRGKQANPFYHHDYQRLLRTNFEEFQRKIFSSSSDPVISRREHLRAVSLIG